MKKFVRKIKNLIQKYLTGLLFDRYLRDMGIGSTVIDCGANVGDISLKLAGTGARLYTFEPNSFAYKVLTERLEAYHFALLFSR